MRMAALLTYSGNASNRFSAAAEIRAFARQIHPRLVAFGRDDRLIHSAVAVVDCADLILGAGGVALRAEITRRFAEWPFDDALVRDQHALDDDFRVGRDEQIVAKRF